MLLELPRLSERWQINELSRYIQKHICYNNSNYIRFQLQCHVRIRIHRFVYLTLYQSSTWLNQIINNHDMTTPRVSLLNTNYPSFSFPNFCTDYLHVHCVSANSWNHQSKLINVSNFKLVAVTLMPVWYL